MLNRFLFIVFIALCGNGMNAQTTVTLHMDQKLGDVPFAFNQVIQVEAGYFYNVTRLQYYISEIKLTHDGGQVTPLPDVYLLVNPALKSDFLLGSYPVTHLEGIQFSIGVDQAHNHLDPATYSSQHPLSPQNPSMHWGWASGYRFIAFEGYSGASENSLPDNFQIHTVGDANYQTLTLPLNAEAVGDQITAEITADYHRLLDNMSVLGGVISHAATGQSRTIAENARNMVFTTDVQTGIVEPGVKGKLSISPNPVSEQALITYQFPDQKKLTLTITDMNGRVFHTEALPEVTGSSQLPVHLPSGLYLALIKGGDRILANEKFIVQ